MNKDYEAENGMTFNFLAKISLTLLAVLLIGAAFFYKLRMVFIDGPFMIFQIIKNDSPDIMVERYGSIVTQIFPFIGQKLAFSLDHIMLLYSVSFNLFYLLVGFIIYKLKQYIWVIILAFYQIGFATDLFFWPNNEIHQGIAWMALTTGFWFYMEHFKTLSKVMGVLLFLMLAIAIFTHPLMIPVVLFLTIFYFLSGIFSFKNLKYKLLLLSVLSLCALKFIVSSNNWYDGGKFKHLASCTYVDWLNVFNRPAMINFISELIHNHLGALVVLFLCIFSLLKYKKYWLLGFILMFTMVYLVFIAMTFAEFKKFYIESQWMPIAIFWITPLVYNLRLKLPDWKILLFPFIILVSWLASISGSITIFQQRLEWTNTVIKQMEKKNFQKLIITDVDNSIKESIILPWGLPVESLILSSARSPSSSRTFLIDQTERGGKGNDIFLSCFEDIQIDKLNKTYFNLDKSSGYQIVKYTELMK